jgi:hypothetical protein
MKEGVKKQARKERKGETIFGVLAVTRARASEF